MPRHHHQTFDQRGNLIEERIEEYAETPPEPTTEERVASLETELQTMRERVAAVATTLPETRAIQNALIDNGGGGILKLRN